jgi:hypothetical protein
MAHSDDTEQSSFAEEKKFFEKDFLARNFMATVNQVEADSDGFVA